mmetsp:Transcript_11934/g.17946  ORF Transcript_11934/g.17946 Transcript_11934/m.17946 type:complete len:768 (-) Transcript_11934:44-2347(-)|eukprot:CAMPEP_0196807688 /NCGR_PEP_ID=MMETSP1362-20130617/7687_1 /TAXON_ID=163516 /ORGANISM="Leptocylindrus danicus, Strain CCMP1856" /LENGTH=767 /DNA_ID=CAMNT_0042181723 /DNA_START=97 /DNA_END=2400 /DNA_ORIENTATION=+
MKIGLLLPVLQLYATNVHVSAWTTTTTPHVQNFSRSNSEIIRRSTQLLLSAAAQQHDYERNPYDDASSPIANLNEVNILLGERVQCKKRKMFAEADDIRDVLQDEYGIYVDDRTRTFSNSADNFNEVRGSSSSSRGGRNNNRFDSNNRYDNSSNNRRRDSSRGRSGNGNGGRRGGFRERDFGPRGHDYDQAGGPILEDCPFDEAQIDALLAERLQAKLNKNFAVADEIQETLYEAGVFVMDADKMWRADGERFGDGSMGAKPGRISGSRADRNRPYEMADSSEPVNSEADKEYIENLVARRAQAKQDRNFDLADDIREELRENLNVQIDDRLRLWSIGGDFGAAMEQLIDAKPDLNRGYAKSRTCGPVSAEDEEYIADMVARRFQAKKDRDYDTADSIRDDLKERMGVFIDDKQRVWSVASNNNGPLTYEQSPSSEQLEADEHQVVVDMLQARSEAKKNREYDTADSIRDHLKSEFNVSVDDKLRQWSVGGDFGASGNLAREGPYTYSGNAAKLEMSDKAIAMIENLLAKRSEAKKIRDFDTADSIRERLRDLVNVEIDDKNREWYLRASPLLSDVDNEFDSDDDGIPFADDEDDYLDLTNDAPESVADLVAFVKSGDATQTVTLSEEDEAYVVSRLARCVEAEIQERDYDTGYAIRTELKTLYGVELDDEAGTWTVVGTGDSAAASEFMVVGDNEEEGITDSSIEEEEEDDDDDGDDDVVGGEVDSEASSEDLSKLTVPELKDRLRNAGLKVGGNKADLIERLLTV